MAVARKAKCAGIESRKKKKRRSSLSQDASCEDPNENPKGASKKRKKKRGPSRTNSTASTPSNSTATPHASAHPSAKKKQKDSSKDQKTDWESLSTEALLEAYQRTNQYEPRDVLVERFLDDVTDLARILHSRLPRSVDLDDLCTAGYSGLMRCLDTFNASKGRSFLSYFRLRVNGAMLDELRAMDWLPRLMRNRLAKRNRVAQELHHQYGRPPSDSEIALALGVDMDTYRRSYPSSAQQVSAGVFSGNEEELDRIEATIIDYMGHSEWEEELHTPWNRIYHQELMHRIEDLLSETEWALVELHYFEGLCLRDVAKRLKLSAARICQIHGKVLERLKDRLRGEGTSC